MLRLMDDITSSLDTLGLAQMLLGWAFLACYALAIGGMLGTRGRRNAAGLAVLVAVLFCSGVENWVHGALLVMFAVGGMGVFTVVAWALAQAAVWAVHRGAQTEPPSAAPAVAPAKPQLAANPWLSLWGSPTRRRPSPRRT